MGALHGQFHLPRFENQRKSHSVLGEFPFDAFSRYLLSPVVGIQRSDDYFEAICRVLLDFHGDTFRTLLGHIHGCGILSVFGRLDVESDSQLVGTNLYLTRPIGQRGRVLRIGSHQADQEGGKERVNSFHYWVVFISSW